MTDVPTDHPLPDFPLDAPDALLVAAIRSQPGIVSGTWRQADSAFEMARHMLDRGQVVHALWRFFGNRARQTADPVDTLRVALHAIAAFRALAEMSQAHLAEINGAPEAALGGTLHYYPHTGRRVCAEARAAAASHPALARVQTEGDARAIAQTAEWKRAGLMQQQWPWELSPAALLRDLRRRQIGLALNDAGRITAHPGTVLLDVEWIAIRRHRAALVELLAAEVDPPRPLVVA